MTNLEVIEELYRAFREQDYDAFLRICTPDLEWIQNDGFPRGAIYRGAAAVVEGVFKAFNHNWKAWAFDIEQYLDAGETIIVIGSYRGKGSEDTVGEFMGEKSGLATLLRIKVKTNRLLEVQHVHAAPNYSSYSKGYSRGSKSSLS